MYPVVCYTIYKFVLIPVKHNNVLKLYCVQLSFIGLEYSVATCFGS
jgi:hypothetical protein